MKILLTGHKGFIGSNAYKYFSTLHEVDGYEWGDTWPGVIDYDWVLHIGAISSTTERDIDKVLRQNYEFSVMVFDECKTFGVNLQYSSSASVYGLNQEFREDSPLDPKTPYAWSKYLFERYAAQHQGGNIVQGFRYFNVHGPGEDHKGAQASPHNQFTNQAQKFGKIKLFENSENYRRDFIHVDQVLDVHNKFLSIPKSGVWNVGTGHATSFRDVALNVANEHNAEIELIPMPDILKSSYQEYTCADLTLLNSTLNE